jgi:hypothetical protein
LPDPGALYVTLGTIAANLVDLGDPVWLLMVGPPSSGKTETLNAVTALPYVYQAATLTEASLLSGTPKKEREAGAKGGLLRRIGDFGILSLKDFTSLLEMNTQSRGQLLAALREIFDGSWTRHVGTSGGLELHWEGKVGLIGGCTPTIDRHHAVIGTMGERMLLFRLPAADSEHLAKRSLAHAGNGSIMRAELSEVVTSLFDEREQQMLGQPPRDLTPTETDWLVNLATVVARCRSAVERDAYSREVELIPEAEEPGRLVNQLRLLWHGMEVVGVVPTDAAALLVRVARSSMPALRRRTIDFVLGADTPSTVDIAEAIGHPTSTTRRTLEDLVAPGILACLRGGDGTAHRWSPTNWIIGHWPDDPAVPDSLGLLSNPQTLEREFRERSPEPAGTS